MDAVKTKKAKYFIIGGALLLALCMAVAAFFLLNIDDGSFGIYDETDNASLATFKSNFARLEKAAYTYGMMDENEKYIIINEDCFDVTVKLEDDHLVIRYNTKGDSEKYPIKIYHIKNLAGIIDVMDIIKDGEESYFKTAYVADKEDFNRIKNGEKILPVGHEAYGSETQPSDVASQTENTDEGEYYEQVEIGEETLPITVADLERMVDNDMDKKDIPETIIKERLGIDFIYNNLPYRYTPGVVRKKGDNYYSIYNTGDSYHFAFFDIRNGELTVNHDLDYFITKNAPSIADFKDIKVGVSTEEDVQKITGEMASVYNSRYSYSITLNDSSSLEITFNFDTKIVTNIDHSKGVRVEIFDRAYEKDLHI